LELQDNIAADPINLAQLPHAWGEGDSGAMAAVAALVNSVLAARESGEPSL